MHCPVLPLHRPCPEHVKNISHSTVQLLAASCCQHGSHDASGEQLGKGILVEHGVAVVDELDEFPPPLQPKELFVAHSTWLAISRCKTAKWPSRAMLILQTELHLESRPRLWGEGRSQLGAAPVECVERQADRTHARAASPFLCAARALSLL